MAQEIVVAREGGVNPVNAVNNGTQRSMEPRVVANTFDAELRSSGYSKPIIEGDVVKAIGTAENGRDYTIYYDSKRNITYIWESSEDVDRMAYSGHTMAETLRYAKHLMR